jgi:hypothetical protein
LHARNFAKGIMEAFNAERISAKRRIGRIDITGRKSESEQVNDPVDERGAEKREKGAVL